MNNFQQPNYAPNVVNQTVTYGGATWKGNPGQGWSLQSDASGNPVGGAGGASSFDPVASAQKLLDFQKTANAPVAAAVGSQIPRIQDQYTQLVNSIKGQQQVSDNSATLNANNELARRGISGGGLYDSSLAGARLPVDVAYSGQLAQTGAGSVQDVNQLALQQAQLLAGDPNAAVGQALQYGGLQNSAQSIANQLTLGQQQNANQLYLGTSSSTPQNVYQLALANSLNGGNISALQAFASQYGLH